MIAPPPRPPPGRPFSCVRFGHRLRGLQLQEGPPVFPVVGQRRAADGGAPPVIGVQDQGVHAQVVLGPPGRVLCVLPGRFVLRVAAGGGTFGGAEKSIEICPTVKYFAPR